MGNKTSKTDSQRRRNQTANNYVYSQTASHESSPLNQNLPNISNNNVQMPPTSYSQPGTSNHSAPVFYYSPQGRVAMDPLGVRNQAAQSIRQTVATTSAAQLIPTTPLASLSPTNLSYSSTSDQSQGKRRRRRRSRNAASRTGTKSGINCVTCHKQLGEKIYQCNTGHSSCEDCKMKNTRCGLCSKVITNMRNITLEETIANIRPNKNNNIERIKCLNSNDGCRLTFDRIEMERHLKNCPFKERACPVASTFGYCNWKGKINQIVTHFNEAHQEHRVAEVDKEMTLSNFTLNHKILHLVNIGNFIFLVHIVSRDQNIYMTVQLLGTKYSASKWTYELHVYNEKGRKYQYIDSCHGDTESIVNIFDENKCAVLARDYAKTFLVNNNLFYKFCIKREFF